MLVNVLQYMNGIYTLSDGREVTYKELSELKDSVYGLHYKENQLVFVDITKANRTRNTIDTEKFMALNHHKLLFAPSSASASHGAVTSKRLSHHIVDSQYLKGKNYTINSKNMFESFCKYDLVGSVYPFYWEYNTNDNMRYSEIKAFPYLIRVIKSKKKGGNAICNIWDVPNATYSKKTNEIISTPEKIITVSELILLWKNYISNTLPSTYEKLQQLMTIKGLTDLQKQYVLEHINLTPIWELGRENNHTIYGIMTLDKGIEVLEINDSVSIYETTLTQTIRSKITTKGLMPQAFVVTNDGTLENCIIQWPKEFGGIPTFTSSTRSKQAQEQINKLGSQNRLYIEIPSSVVHIKTKSITIYNDTFSYFPSSIKTVEKNSIKLVGQFYSLKRTIIHLENCSKDVQNILKQQIMEAATKKIKAYGLDLKYSYKHSGYIHNYVTLLGGKDNINEDTAENLKKFKNMTPEEIFAKCSTYTPKIIVS